MEVTDTQVHETVAFLELAEHEGGLGSAEAVFAGLPERYREHEDIAYVMQEIRVEYLYLYRGEV